MIMSAYRLRVLRHADLVHCRRQRLGDADAEDVGQRDWLQLVDQPNRIRDPAALPGWLAALREAFRDLPPSCRRLILLLLEDPPIPYAEMSARLGVPAGSIGPPGVAAWTSCDATRPSLA